jgi:hypothetical protein
MLDPGCSILRGYPPLFDFPYSLTPWEIHGKPMGNPRGNQRQYPREKTKAIPNGNPTATAKAIPKQKTKRKNQNEKGRGKAPRPYYVENVYTFRRLDV